MQRLMRLGLSAETADRLRRLGFDSAHKIAGLPEHAFLRKIGQGDADLGRDEAKELHRRARATKGSVQNAFLALKGLAGDAHFARTRAANMAQDIQQQIASVPDFQDLFGELNYLQCSHCASIFGPAAYFLDMMRIIDDYVTAPNTGKPSGNIPDEYLLETRRPDLFELDLTCEHTNTPVLYLTIVNRILEKKVAADTDGKPFQTLATAVYPFNLPFNRPLAEIRAHMTALDTSLAALYSALLTDNDPNEAGMVNAIARERLGLSIEEESVVTTPQTTDTGLGPYYGYNKIGPKRLHKLSNVSVFLERTGLTRDALFSLLEQDTAPDCRAKVAPGFFINDTGETNIAPYMSVRIDNSDPDNYREFIDGLSLLRLDRINRFVRLQAALGWSYANLDWALRSVGATEIKGAIVPFGGIQVLHQATGLAIDRLAAMWYDVKTIGRVNDPPAPPQDLFDRIFNKPALLQGRDPYHPNSGVPFDPADPVDWKPDGDSASNLEIRSRLNAALALSDEDLTRIADFQMCLTGKKFIRTDLENLSALYRLSSGTAFGITVQEYLLLLRMLYDPTAACADRPKTADGLSVAEVFRQNSAVEWLEASDFDIYEVSYIMTGKGYGYVDPGYLADEIGPFVNSLALLSEGARLGPDSFVFVGLDAEGSATLFDYVKTNPKRRSSFVSERGIFSATEPSFKLIAPALPVAAADLVTGLIDLKAAKSAFSLLIAHDIIIAKPDAMSGPISESFGPETPLNFLFVGTANAKEKRDQVREVLDANKALVEHSLSVMQEKRDLQISNASEGLAGFLDADVAMIDVLAPFAAAETGLPDYLQALLTPLPDDTTLPDGLETMIAVLSQALLLADKLAATPTDMAAIISTPKAFGIDKFTALSFENVRTMWQFQKLVRQFNDTDNSLIRYFETDGSGRAKTILAELTGWPRDQIDILFKHFWAGTPKKGQSVMGVWRMDQVFSLNAGTGLSPASLLRLSELATLPVTHGGHLSETNWKTYTDAAASTLDAVGAKYDDEFEEVVVELEENLSEQKRDALLGYTIFELGKTVPEVKSATDLYQYLLIDVEMTSCDKISLISQAHASVQLYLQRVRLNLEPGITELPIPEVWWEWMSAYRIWEANRKIFLYPENYLEPTLRNSQTPLYDELRQTLLQNEVTAVTVSDAYSEYMDEFARLANLVIVSTYRATVTDPETKRDTETIFIFARTNTEPYQYYWRKCEGYTVADVNLTDKTAMAKAFWGPWAEIAVTIPAPLVTPVYAFGKLMIFWVEMAEITNSIINAQQQSENHTVYEATIKYSFLDFRQRWIEPQTYQSGIIVNFQPNTYLDGWTFASIYNPAHLFWHKVYVAHVTPGTYVDQPFYDREQLLVIYGPSVSYLPNPDAKPLQKPDPTGFREEDRLNTEVHQTTVRWANMSTTPSVTPGRVAAQRSAAVASNLLQQDRFIALLDGTPGTLPDQQTKAISANIGDRKLYANTLYPNVIVSNYYTDSAQVRTPQAELSFELSGDDGDEPAAAADPGDGDSVVYSDVLLDNLAPVNTAIVTVKNQPAWFVYDNGDDVFLSSAQLMALSITETLKASDAIPNYPSNMTMVYNTPYTPLPMPDIDKIDFAFSRLGTTAIAQLSQTLFTGGIAALLTIRSQEAEELPFGRFAPGPQVINATSDRIDFDGAYGPYYWEVFFHGPFLVADALNGNQRFAEAKTWYEYIFNPTAMPKAEIVASLANPNDIYWNFLPFRNLTWESLTQILSSVGQITAYNDDPFDPHAIARLRPSAYPKAVVMRYIDNLLDWGDALYAQDTRESITQATNLYVLAADLLGPRPENVGTFKPHRALNYTDIKTAYAQSGTVAAATMTSVTLDGGASDKDDFYNGLTITLTEGQGAGQSRTVLDYDGASRRATVKTWDKKPDTETKYAMSGIPQFLIELENSPLVLAATSTDTVIAEAPFNDIDAYFCIPENEEFIAYWDRVDDRLFKIRHCMDIHGVVRQLALFSPPVDPRALVRAAASGGFISQVAGGVAQPTPFYRFAPQLEAAKNLTNVVSGLGAALLAALEKKDAEELALLQQTQQAQILQLTTQVREDQIEMIARQRAALEDSLQNAQQRKEYYTRLLAEDISPGEQENLDQMGAALEANIAAGVTRIAASIGYAVPQFGSPFAMTYGGQQIGSVLSAAAGVFEMFSLVANYIGTRSLTMAGYQRRAEEWEFQVGQADGDIQQITEQIAANDIQSDIARQELMIHEATIAQNQETLDFLRRKFTNKDLYQWMAGQLSTLYFQTYSLAHEMGMAAQRAFQYELDSNKTFLNFGYWDSLHKGLLAGEGMMLGLNQMEAAYLTQNNRRLEIERTVSLAQTSPEALFRLRETGECAFELTEAMFDQDYPGHYARKIKTVSMSLPAVIGPYQNIKATLTQTRNQIAITGNLQTVKYLLGIDQGAAPGPDKLRTDWWVNQSVAMSSGLNDSGLFQVDFQDARFLPFEGTGAVSNWRLSMPKAANRFDYSTISDVIFTVKYTAEDGGAKLRNDVVKLGPVKSYASGQLYAVAQQWSADWLAFMRDHDDKTTQILRFRLSDPIAPPQVDVSAVTAVSLHMEVDQDKSAKGDYLKLVLPGKTKEHDVPIGANNSGEFEQNITGYEGEWQLRFDLNAAPKSILTDGFVDPVKLKNIGFVLFYDGALNWETGG